MNSWNKIWKSKGDQKKLEIVGRSEYDVFCDLKKIDGFDVAVEDESAYFYRFYEESIKHVNKFNEFTKGYKSAYEVGCGDGVNLYIIKNRFDNVSLGGCDLSENLLGIAKTVVEGEYDCCEASDIDINTKYDIVFSDSVFQYFPSFEYAKDVLTKMVNKANKLVFLGEVHDYQYREEWLANRRKQIENYDEKYEGLGRVFLSREWLSGFAEENGMEIRFEKIDNEAYWSSKYIYNVYLYY